MKIGFVTPEYVTESSVDGGLANYLQKTARQLTERGHRVTVFVQSDRHRRWMDKQVSIIEIRKYSLLQEIIFKRLYVPSKLRCLVPFIHHVCAAKRVASVVWKENQKAPFDIFQTSNYNSPGLFLTENKNIPVVCRVSSYTPLLRSATGGQRHFSDMLTDWLEVRLVKKAEAAFSPSRFVASTFLRLEGMKVDVVRTPLDVDTKNLDRSFYQKNLSGMQYFLFFGTLNKIKGVDLLSSVIPEVIKKHPEIIFVFTGRDDGMSEGIKMFDYLKNVPGMPVKNILYFPAIAKEKLYPVIENAVAAIIPSRVDNYPNVCLEAQSMGIPVIAADNSSLEEMVVDGETGFLARNSDPESLYQAIERFLQMPPEQKERMKKNILEEMEKIKAEDRIGILINYYEQVVKKWQNPG